jgi:hypothetical protein
MWQEITEGEFLETVTNTPHVVTHFFQEGFERCKIMDKHLAILARKYWDTRFVKLSAPVSGPKPSFRMTEHLRLRHVTKHGCMCILEARWEQFLL